MADINEFALQQAEAAAAKMWAFGSAPFPLASCSLTHALLRPPSNRGMQLRTLCAAADADR
jgi:hypothetical protein